MGWGDEEVEEGMGDGPMNGKRVGGGGQETKRIWSGVVWINGQYGAYGNSEIKILKISMITHNMKQLFNANIFILYMNIKNINELHLGPQ